MEQRYDVVIVGGGPGGAAAAKVLAAGGKRVAVIESGDFGGTCVNRGCIPTKFLLAATAPLGTLHDHKRFGSLTGDLTIDLNALQKRKNRFVAGTSTALAKSLQSMGITLFQGRGVLAGQGSVEVSGENPVALVAGDIILATGSAPASLPGIEPDGVNVLDSTMILNLESVPSSLIIVGAGAIGMEFSNFYSAMGAKVYLVEGMPQLLPSEDADIARELEKIITKSGRECVTGRKVDSVASVDGGAELRFDDGQTLRAEKALIAIGRKAVTTDLGLDTAGIGLTERGFIRVNAELEAAPHCYAVGDGNGRTLLAHAAEHQGEWVARRILGSAQGPYLAGPVPSCVFGHVEVMRAGMTAKEVARTGRETFVSSVPFTINPIAQAHASTAGFAKAVWDGERLAGMAAVGHHAAHLVTAAQLLVLHGHTPESLKTFMFAHPTLDEILKSAIHAPRAAYV